MAEDRKPTRKVDAKPVQQVPPSSMPSRDNAVKITLSLNIDKAIKQKLPFLIAIAVLFLFACFMLARANFSIGDLFNFQRISDNLEKLYSLSFILFIIIFSLALSLSVLYGFKLDSQTALVSMLVLIVPLLIAFMAYPRYSFAFVAIAFPVGLTAFFASMRDKLNIAAIYSSISKALFIFVLLSTAFTLVKVQGEKDIYFDNFLNNTVRLAPAVQSQLQGTVADAIEGIEINASRVALLIGTQASAGGSDVAAVPLVTREQAGAAVAQAYEAYRTEMLAGFIKAEDKAYADGKMTKYSALPQAKKDEFIDAFYSKFSVGAPATGGGSNSDAIAAGVAALWPQIKKALADEVRNAPSQDASNVDVTSLKQRLASIPLFRTFYDNFEYFVALIIMSLLSVVSYIFKLFGTLMGFGLVKLIT
ncbi:MAG: hypothetical protein V1787_05265 [Candidatus Micrarchaeota archaeon]